MPSMVPKSRCLRSSELPGFKIIILNLTASLRFNYKLDHEAAFDWLEKEHSILEICSKQKDRQARGSSHHV